MTTYRIIKSSINWYSLAERVPTNQKANFKDFKSKSDTYLRKLMATPEVVPAINWEYYRKLIPNVNIVDKFEQSYNELKIPYPENNLKSQIDMLTKETKADIDKFLKLSNNRITLYENQINYLKSLLPYDQMTMEDCYDAFPDIALNSREHPTFWPHLPEDQIGYKRMDAPQ